MKKRLLSALLALVFAVSLVPVLPVTAHAMTLQENLSESFESFRIDGTTDVLSGIFSGTGSGGGTWEVSVYDITSTKSIVRIDLDNYVGENIYIKHKAGKENRSVVIATKGTCVITGHLRSWPGIWYECKTAHSLGISVKDQLTIKGTDCGIRLGIENYPINDPGTGEAYLFIEGGGLLDIEARVKGIHSLSGQSLETDHSMWYGSIDIKETSVSIKCTDSNEWYGIVTGGLRDELHGGWINKGLKIRDGASVKVQMAAGSHALRHDEVSYVLDDDYVEDGSFYGDYWYVRPSSMPEPHTITIVNGTADKTTAKKGEKITITANTPPNGKVFDVWSKIQGDSNLTDKYSATTTFTMPDGDVTFKAEWKDEESDTNPNATHTVNAGSLTVRQDPDSSSPRIGGLTQGDEVKVLETQGEWSKIEYQDSYGWVMSQYLTANFSFTTQPVSGTAKKTEDYTFSWATNETPDEVYLMIWYPEMNTWSAQNMTTDPSTWAATYYDFFADGIVSRYKIKAIKGSESIYSDEFTVTWTEDTPAIAFTTQPVSGTAKKAEDYTYTWDLNDTPDSLVIQAWFGDSWHDGSSLMGKTSDTVSFSDTISKYRIKATKGSETIYSNEFAVTWTEDSEELYAITVENGNANKYTASEGDIITITATPPTGKEFDHWEVITGNITGKLTVDVTLADKNSITNSFSMPAGNVYIRAAMKGDELPNPFTDVFKSDPYFDAVLWAYYAVPQITDGMTDTTFGPELTVTRGQCVTFLWRAMGKPEPSGGKNPFTDVPADQYYYKAVLWAVEKGITDGVTDTTFEPNTTLSTQHIITFLYRTLNPGKDGWSGEAVAWAGKDNGGKPFGVDIAVDNKTDCPRWCVVQFLYKTVK